MAFAALLAALAPPVASAAPAHKTENVVVIVTDGLRWQEVFRGAETALVSDKPGGNVEGAENMWIAVLGPDTPAQGERRNAARVTQSQIAATVARLLGKDWQAFNPKAGTPLSEAIGGR
jgi:hypothetical protein